MQCISASTKTRVIDSRVIEDGPTSAGPRVEACGESWLHLETSRSAAAIIKSDGRREVFDARIFALGYDRACRGGRSEDRSIRRSRRVHAVRMAGERELASRMVANRHGRSAQARPCGHGRFAFGTRFEDVADFLRNREAGTELPASESSCLSVPRRAAVFSIDKTAQRVQRDRPR